MQWFAHAPSNIALIKYMGKKDDAINIPANPSLSYTLNNLLSYVALETHAGTTDYWEPLIMPGVVDFKLSAASQARFLKHLAYLKEQFNYTGAFMVRSSNNFPLGSGLASSASSFAALTKCAVLALSELTQTELPTIAAQANMSRRGSGSSCRSFFEPWAFWEGEEVKAIEFPAYPKLLHQVVVISHAEKAVSSSEAHRRIITSPYYEHRAERAIKNLITLRRSLETKNWSGAYHVCWHEFHDLHALFTSSSHPFAYINQEAQTVLNKLQDEWHKNGDGPIVTMDAGPNIHLLYRLDQEDLARKFKHDYLLGQYDVL
jgi:diphosphomevalonate decarboxylase